MRQENTKIKCSHLKTQVQNFSLFRLDLLASVTPGDKLTIHSLQRIMSCVEAVVEGFCRNFIGNNWAKIVFFLIFSNFIKRTRCLRTWDHRSSFPERGWFRRCWRPWRRWRSCLPALPTWERWSPCPGFRGWTWNWNSRERPVLRVRRCEKPWCLMDGFPHLKNRNIWD